MSKQPQDTSAEEPDGGNPHIRFRGGPRLGDRPGLLNRWTPSGAHRLLQVSVLTDPDARVVVLTNERSSTTQMD